MPITLNELRNMTLLQMIGLPDEELNRLGRESLHQLNIANSCRQRIRNARYLRRLAKARELACSMDDVEREESV